MLPYSVGFSSSVIAIPSRTALAACPSSTACAEGKKPTGLWGGRPRLGLTGRSAFDGGFISTEPPERWKHARRILGAVSGGRRSSCLEPGGRFLRPYSLVHLCRGSGASLAFGALLVRRAGPGRGIGERSPGL